MGPLGMPAPATRLRSVDAFRGLTMAGMVIVNNPGDWNTVYPPLLHAEWHGWTPTDLIFPWFLVVMGVAMALAGPERAPWPAVLRRTAIIVGLGLALSGFPYFNPARWRIPGVLVRIGLCYLAATLVWRSLARPDDPCGDASAAGRRHRRDPARLLGTADARAAARRGGGRPGAGPRSRRVARSHAARRPPVEARLGSRGPAEHAAGGGLDAPRRDRRPVDEDGVAGARPPARWSAGGVVLIVGGTGLGPGVPDQQVAVDQLLRAVHGRRRRGRAGRAAPGARRRTGESRAPSPSASRWWRWAATRCCCSCCPGWWAGC